MKRRKVQQKHTERGHTVLNLRRQIELPKENTVI